MVGIYKITNKINGKIYIGQSNNCERRFQEHCAPSRAENSRIPVDLAIKKYGKENFSFEVVEQCNLELLNSREEYWIKYFNSIKDGYNCNAGGNQASIGSNNGRAKLTEEDIIVIRKAYAEHKKQKEVYEQFKDKVSFSAFQTAWQGKSWSHIMSEVFTEENKNYYIYQNSIGSKGFSSKLTDDEVIEIRHRYINETAEQIYQDYKDRIKYQTLQQILWGRTYKHLPIYKKKTKQWINI